MKSKSLILILIALGCGLVASVGISQVMGRNGEVQEQPEIETVEILVAMTRIDVGETFTAENVKMEAWPKHLVPEGSLSELTSTDKKFARTVLTEGQPVTERMLMDNLDTKIIPEGYRVIPVKVSSDVVSGLVLPGDRVDVLVLLRAGGEIPRTTVKTVLKDVRIFDVNNETERIMEEGKSVNVRTVSLLLSPSKVELLTLASDMGKIRLSLRRHNDTKNDNDYSGATMNELVGDGTLRGTDPKGSAGPGSFEHLLNQIQQNKASKQQTAVAVPLGPAFTTEVHTPNGVTRFTWDSVDQMPRQDTGAPSATNSGQATGAEKASGDTGEATDLEPKTNDEPEEDD